MAREFGPDSEGNTVMTESSVDPYSNSMSPITIKETEGETMRDTEATSEARYGVAIGSGFLVLGAITLFILIPRSIRVPENIPNIALSPAMWPKAISIFIMLLGVFMLASSLISLWRQNKTLLLPSLVNFRKRIAVSWRGTLAVALLLPYYLAINIFGILLSSVLAIFIYMLIAGEKNIIALILMSLVFPFLLTYFFIHVASVMIPLGPLDIIM